jgi:hypothetical protein
MYPITPATAIAPAPPPIPPPMAPALVLLDDCSADVVFSGASVEVPDVAWIVEFFGSTLGNVPSVVVAVICKVDIVTLVVADVSCAVDIVLLVVANVLVVVEVVVGVKS